MAAFRPGQWLPAALGRSEAQAHGTAASCAIALRQTETARPAALVRQAASAIQAMTDDHVANGELIRLWLHTDPIGCHPRKADHDI
jgi:hypothetical protein